MAMCCIFEEDEVSTVKSDGLLRCGIVLESSEYLSSDETDSEGAQCEDKVRKGTVRVAWHPDGAVEVLEEKNLFLVDRSLMPGESVRRLVAGHDSQRGFVSQTSCLCCVQVLGKNMLICNVQTNDLEPLTTFETDPGDVYLDSWVGKIEKISDKVTVGFHDGARCEVSEEDLSTFEDILDKRDPSSEYAIATYYPGQQLRGEFGCLERATWLQRSINHCPAHVRKDKTREVTFIVESVVVDSVEVHWLCRGYAEPTNITTQLLEPPPRVITGDRLKRLKRLDCFQSSGFQLGHKAFYTLKETDVVITRKHHIKRRDIHEILSSQGFLPSSLAFDKRLIDSVASIHKSDEIVEEKTELSVEGFVVVGDEANDICNTEGISSAEEEGYYDAEDGTKSDEAESITQLTNDAKHANRKPVSRKLLKKRKRVKAARTKQNVTFPQAGDKIPVEIVYTKTLVDVVWQDGTVEKGVPSNDLFPIHHLDDLEFFPGDFVVSSTDSRYDAYSGVYGVVQSVQHTGRTCQVVWLKPSSTTLRVDVLETTEVSVYDIKDHPDIKYRLGHIVVRVDGYKDSDPDASSVCDFASSSNNGHVPVINSCENVTNDMRGVPVAAGQIYEVGIDGRLTVEWVDGSRSKCSPHQLYLVSDEMSDYDDLLTNEDDDMSVTESSATSCDWETEEEEQVPGNDTGIDSGNLTSSDNPSLPGGNNATQIDDFEAFLGAMKLAISKLDELVRLRTHEDVVGICRPVLSIYRTCRDFDRSFGSSFFSDEVLMTIVSDIRNELRKDRSAFMNKQVLELVESNRRRHRDSTGSMDSNHESSPQCTEPALLSLHSDYFVSDTEVISRKPVTPEVTPCVIDVIEDCKSEIRPNTVDGEESSYCVTQQSETPAFLNTEKPEACEIRDEILQISQSLTELSRKLNVSHKLISSETVAPTNHLFIVNGERAVDGADHINVHVISDLHSSEITMANEDSGVCIGDECAKVSTKSPVTEGGNCRPKMHIAQQLCHSACLRLGTLMSDNKADILAVLTKIPIHFDFMIECDGKTSMSSSDIKTAVEHALSQNVESSAQDVSSTTADPTQNVPSKFTMSISVKKTLYPPSQRSSIPVAETQYDSDAQLEVPVEPSPSTPIHMPAVVVESSSEYIAQGFCQVEAVADSHRFKHSEHKPVDGRAFINAVSKELKLLQSCLPEGILVKGYEDRMDLFSVMIQGPSRTPYEDGLFFFEVQLPNDYPNSPPVFYYVSFCTDRLNPNLYEDGKVCVSLLGTWTGKGTENWSNKSNLLQVLISIQGLILNPEPYYNEAGYEKQKGSQQGLENSRLYNEMAILKLTQSMMKMVTKPVPVFESEIKTHLEIYAHRMIARLKYWLHVMPSAQGASIVLAQPSCLITAPYPSAAGDMDVAAEFAPSSEISPASGLDSLRAVAYDGSNTRACSSCQQDEVVLFLPEFPLLPVSRGFKLTVDKLLDQFTSALLTANITLRERVGGQDAVPNDPHR